MTGQGATPVAEVDEAQTVRFPQRTIDAGGSPVDIAEAGDGAPLIYLGTSTDTLAGLLARDFRVVALEPDSGFTALTPAMKARRIAAVAAALSLETYSVCAAGADTQAAAHLAADDPEKLQRAILLAPDVFDARGVLNDPSLSEKTADIACHSLALFGTDAGGHCEGNASHYRERLPKCHLMYVYDAPDPARDRPDAAASVIADFLRRGEGFLVSEKDGRVHP
ncbi:MAG: hypothetical protein AB7F96_06635 [Beijerinckiaceae bacterium]